MTGRYVSPKLDSHLVSDALGHVYDRTAEGTVGDYFSRLCDGSIKSRLGGEQGERIAALAARRPIQACLAALEEARAIGLAVRCPFAFGGRRLLGR